jgi:polyisoprenoid-binding protein YceI
MKGNWIAVVGLLAAAALARADDTYKIDPAHTMVSFAVNHLVINKVHGRFKQ